MTGKKMKEQFDTLLDAYTTAQLEHGSVASTRAAVLQAHDRAVNKIVRLRKKLKKANR